MNRTQGRSVARTVALAVVLASLTACAQAGSNRIHRPPVELHVGALGAWQLNGQAVKHPDLAWRLRALAALDQDQPVFVTPGAGVRFGSVRRALLACEHAGLRAVSLRGAGEE